MGLAGGGGIHQMVNAPRSSKIGLRRRDEGAVQEKKTPKSGHPIQLTDLKAKCSRECKRSQPKIQSKKTNPPPPYQKKSNSLLLLLLLLLALFFFPPNGNLCVSVSVSLFPPSGSLSLSSLSSLSLKNNRKRHKLGSLGK